MNDIVWVSASIDGSRLKIQIKENEDTFQEVQKEEKPCESDRRTGRGDHKDGEHVPEFPWCMSGIR